MLPLCQPRQSHFQSLGSARNWCRYGGRINSQERHDEGGEAFAANPDLVHRCPRLRPDAPLLAASQNPGRSALPRPFPSGISESNSETPGANLNRHDCDCIGPSAQKTRLRMTSLLCLISCGGDVAHQAKAGVFFLFFSLLSTVIPVSSQQAAERPIALHPENPRYFLYRNRALALVGSGEHYGLCSTATSIITNIWRRFRTMG